MSAVRNAKVVAMHAEHLVRTRFRSQPPLQVLHYRMRNWGDSINPLFASYLTSRRVVSVDIESRGRFPDSYRGPFYLGIGSILHHADSQTVVWGSGLQEPRELRERPRDITAVRGPLTHAALGDRGVKAPRVFGDPVLLLPRFYTPSPVEKKFALGLVSHIKDVDSPAFTSLRKDPAVTFISMRGRGTDLVDAVAQCEAIASTSLHGLVLADAYGIPAVWIKVSDRIPGRDFKFHDYHRSLGLGVEPFGIDPSATCQDVRASCRPRPLDLDLDALHQACPYPA